MQSSHEYCSKCQATRNMSITKSERNEVDANGDTKIIVTSNFHCETCQSFIRSEEAE